MAYKFRRKVIKSTLLPRIFAREEVLECGHIKRIENAKHNIPGALTRDCKECERQSIPCPSCKHKAHLKNDCMERVMDAAGDIDFCPCQAGPSIERKAGSFSFTQRLGGIVNDLLIEMEKRSPFVQETEVDTFLAALRSQAALLEKHSARLSKAAQEEYEKRIKEGKGTL